MRRISTKTKVLMMAGALLLSAGWGVGNTQADSMTVGLLVDMALQDNPTLAAMRADWAAMREMSAQDEALPNPMVTYKGMDTADNFPGADEQRYEAQQTFPWPGKRGLKGRIAERDAEKSRLEYEAMRLETVMKVKESYYELCAIKNSIAILQAEEAVLKQMAQVAETKYAAGEVNQQDAVKAQAEVPMLQGKLLELQAREAALFARLNMLINRSATDSLELRIEPPPRVPEGGMEPLLAAAQTNRPEIKASQAMVERGEAQRALMRKEYLPDLTVGFEYRQLSGTAEDMAMFMVGMDLPVWRGRNAAGVREAERRIASSRAAVEAAQREAQYDVRESWFRLRNAEQTLDLYEKELIPQAELRFQASEAGYRAGRVDFMDLLESERFLLNARLMRAMAEGDVGMQSARLERAVGVMDERDGL